MKLSQGFKFLVRENLAVTPHQFRNFYTSKISYFPKKQRGFYFCPEIHVSGTHGIGECTAALGLAKILLTLPLATRQISVQSRAALYHL